MRRRGSRRRRRRHDPRGRTEPVTRRIHPDAHRHGTGRRAASAGAAAGPAAQAEQLRAHAPLRAAPVRHRGHRRRRARVPRRGGCHERRGVHGAGVVAGVPQRRARGRGQPGDIRLCQGGVRGGGGGDDPFQRPGGGVALRRVCRSAARDDDVGRRVRARVHRVAGVQRVEHRGQGTGAGGTGAAGAVRAAGG